MLTWGISALSHDAALSVVIDDELVFAAHAERYSRRKNDAFLHPELIAEALTYGVPDHIAWYERPVLKKLRQFRARQFNDALTLDDLPTAYLRSLDLPFRVHGISHYASHHDSHIAAAVSTCGFSDAAVITADSIGEFATLTVSHYIEGRGVTRIHQRNYPSSIGLLYSAFTRRCGFKPNEDEYIVMGMASIGHPVYFEAIMDDFVKMDYPSFRLKINPHKGIGAWMPQARVEDLAASIQAVTEHILVAVARWARNYTGSKALVLAGGVALNCAANSIVAKNGGFENFWIFPNPGDAGSSFGSVADMIGKPISWPGPYLGTSIESSYPVGEILGLLNTRGMVGVASGSAEFGPRALGNRSILADPRPPDMKDRVNAVKGRELFRPFAPVLRLENASRYFDMPVNASPYMQFTGRCLQPEFLPAVTHTDGTSRVQTVTDAQHHGLYELLGEWEAMTGCPVLLNTSLNSRSEPLVNSRIDAERFSLATGLDVL